MSGCSTDPEMLACTGSDVPYRKWSDLFSDPPFMFGFTPSEHLFLYFNNVYVFSRIKHRTKSKANMTAARVTAHLHTPNSNKHLSSRELPWVCVSFFPSATCAFFDWRVASCNECHCGNHRPLAMPRHSCVFRETGIVSDEGVQPHRCSSQRRLVLDSSL